MKTTTLPFNYDAKRRYDFAALLYNSGLSMQAISNLFNVTQPCVHYQLHKRHVVVHPLGTSGPRNPFYRHGRGNHKEVGRGIARRRFKEMGECERCRQKPAVDRHHVDGNTFNNTAENIQRLCRACHSAVDGRSVRLAELASRKRTKTRCDKGQPRQQQRRPELDKLVELYKQGKGFYEIAKLTGKSYGAVHGALLRRGIRPRPPSSQELSPADQSLKGLTEAEQPF